MSELESEAEPSDDLKSSLSLEEMLQMKDKLNRKMYSELIFGPSSENKEEKPRPKGPAKRANHHRPREESSKKPPKGIIEVFPVKKQQQVKRDPRFEEAAGKYDEKIFKARFSFLDEIRQKERENLEKEFKKEKDPERKAKIATLIQRYDNQRRSEQAKQERENLIKKLKEEKRKQLGTNKKQIYLNKSEIKKAELVEKFKELKKSSKLKKYLERKRKRNTARERSKVFSN